jgi:hypothetical protein
VASAHQITPEPGALAMAIESAKSWKARTALPCRGFYFTDVRTDISVEERVGDTSDCFDHG